jgi:hypothetical protein
MSATREEVRLLDIPWESPIHEHRRQRIVPPVQSIAALIPFQVAATVGSSQQFELLEV